MSLKPTHTQPPLASGTAAWQQPRRRVPTLRRSSTVMRVELRLQGFTMACITQSSSRTSCPASPSTDGHRGEPGMEVARLLMTADGAAVPAGLGRVLPVRGTVAAGSQQALVGSGAAVSPPCRCTRVKLSTAPADSCSSWWLPPRSSTAEGRAAGTQHGLHSHSGDQIQAPAGFIHAGSRYSAATSGG